MRRRKKVAFSLNNKKHTRCGIASFILSLSSIIVFLAAVITSASTNTDSYQVAITIGLIEFFSFLITIVGLVFGLVGQFTKETNKYYAHWGIGLNVFLLAVHIFVLVNGHQI